MSVSSPHFPTSFKQLTGRDPFPWQTALYDRLRVGQGDIPKRCDIPTGLGKTSVIACWLLARQVNTLLPRRLVYVVNRRTVVDQTTAEVETYKRHFPGLAVSTLRGQFADNRAWSADPSKPAVICGTVDMIGSRLLFSGYGIGMKSKPLHAGFLGQDTLIVHDEAHLEPAFQELLTAIASEQKRTDSSPVRVMALSATGREAEGADVVCLSPDDRANPEVHKRIHSTKALTLHPVADDKSLADKLVELARSHESSGRAVLVFVSRLESVGRVVDGLKKLPVCQLTGTMRGWERDQLVNDPIFRRFLPGAVSDGTTVYLVCTSSPWFYPQLRVTRLRGGEHGGRVRSSM